MASSIFKRGMAYLGLVDDDYDDYDSYGQATEALAGAQRVQAPEPVEEPRPAAHTGRVQARRHEPAPQSQAPTPISSRPTSSTVRIASPEVPVTSSRVNIVTPGRFGDAQEIANLLMANQPVIVNMQSAERDLQRRMIDFCSGVTYALAGGMERVADEVFLLTPSNVKVSDEERQRLADSGLVTS